MKHWRPRIAEAAEQALAGGADTLVGLVLAPHYSTLSIEATASGSSRRSAAGPSSAFIESWHDHEPYLDVLADRVRGTDAHVVFTAHSLPARILDQGDPYKEQLLETSRLVAARAGLESWSFAFQSASADRRAVARPGHPRRARRSPRPWRGTRPRLPDRLRLRPSRDPLGPRRRGRERAAELGLDFDRIESLNDDPALRPRAGRACTRGRFSTLDRDGTGPDRRRGRLSALPRQPAQEPHAQGGDPAPEVRRAEEIWALKGRLVRRSTRALPSGSSAETGRARRRCSG